MNYDIDTQVKINSLMRSKNGIQIMEEPYAEWDRDYRKEFNTWKSKETKLIKIEPDGIVEIYATRE